MKKYKWSLYKAIEFVNNRRPDLEIRASFIQQLSKYEKRLYQQFDGVQTEKWTELSSRQNRESEELITNTFLNSQTRPFVNETAADVNTSAVPKVKFVDESDKAKPLAILIAEDSKVVSERKEEESKSPKKVNYHLLSS